MSEFLIIIPAFNEEHSIGNVIDKINDTVPGAHVLVVDDASRDRTRKIARQKGVMLISHTFNLGYGGALQSGFRVAVKRSYDFAVTIDADEQHDPLYIKNLIDARRESSANVVIGSRFIGNGYNIGVFKKIGIFVLSKITRLYTGVLITDPTSGFQLLDRSAFSFLAGEESYPLDYPDANIIMLLHKKKFRIVETRVKMFQRLDGKSMHSGLKPVLYVLKMFLAIIMVILRKT